MHSDANALTVTNVASVGGLCVAEVLARGLVHVAKTIVACTAGGRPLHLETVPPVTSLCAGDVEAPEEAKKTTHQKN